MCCLSSRLYLQSTLCLHSVLPVSLFLSPSVVVSACAHLCLPVMLCLCLAMSVATVPSSVSVTVDCCLSLPLSLSSCCLFPMSLNGVPFRCCMGSAAAYSFCLLVLSLCSLRVPDFVYCSCCLFLCLFVSQREARPSCASGSSLPTSCTSDLIESYVLLEHPDLVLPVVKGVSRDKKSRRWAVYYKGQRHYFYDKNCGGCRRAYELAVHLRRQQVEEVEICQVYDEQLQQMQQGPPGAPDNRGPCPGPCLRALVAYLLSDFADFMRDRGQETVGIDAEMATAAAAVAAAHAAAAKHAAGTTPILDHIAVLRHCIVSQQLPSQLPAQQQLQLLRQLLLLQLASVKDLLLQTGLWRAILSHAAARQQQQQQESLTSSKAELSAPSDAVAAAATSAAAAESHAAPAETAEETAMCVDC